MSRGLYYIGTPNKNKVMVRFNSKYSNMKIFKIKKLLYEHESTNKIPLKLAMI